MLKGATYEESRRTYREMGCVMVPTQDSMGRFTSLILANKMGFENVDVGKKDEFAAATIRASFYVFESVADNPHLQV
jgi:hypothetical protein